VISSSEIDQILYADSKHCPHLGLLMQASAAKLAGGWGWGWGWGRGRLLLGAAMMSSRCRGPHP